MLEIEFSCASIYEFLDVIEYQYGVDFVIANRKVLGAMFALSRQLLLTEEEYDQ